MQPLLEEAGHRLLNDDQGLELGSKIAQIFSGVMFSVLVMYLTFSNSTRLSYIQRASLEKRLNVCCTINCMVAAISAALNFFQITEVDNWMLPGTRDMVVDVARPLEWILTCPMMQLCLVLMGGSRIPEYRRVLMPSLAAIVLVFGTATLFLDEPFTYVFFVCGALVHSCAMFLNRKQILEHSNGTEGLLVGDSEFRKATLILMGTWFPFPIWYFLSPEGLGLIDNILLVQMGWAFLNIAAKFSSIFYIQRVKDNYKNHLKVKRAMQECRGEDESAGFKKNGELKSCVVETMTFLGMAENCDRFMNLLQQAQVTTFAQIERLTRDDCMRLQLPFDLVCALQKRQKVWRMEMVDGAEQDLEDGERHYNIASPFNGQSDVGNPRICDSSAWPPGINAGGKDALYIGDQELGMDYRGLEQLEKRLVEQFQYSIELSQRKLEECMQTVEKQTQVSEQRLDDSIRSFGNQIMANHQQFEECIQKVDKQSVASQKTLEAAIQTVGEQIELSQEMLGNRLREVVERAQSSMEGKVELEFAKGPFKRMTEEIVQEAKANAWTLQMKVDAMEKAQTQISEDLEKNICSKIQARIEEVSECVSTTVVQQSQSSVERIQSIVLDSTAAVKGEQSKFELRILQLSKDVCQECTKSVEVAVGTLGNSLRAQLESMEVSVKSQVALLETGQQKLQGECERNMSDKLHGFVSQLQQHTRSEVAKIGETVETSVRQSTGEVSRREMDSLTEFRKFMEAATQNQQDRFQDVYSMISSVLEQACGAKVKADECLAKVSSLTEQLGCDPRSGANSTASAPQSRPNTASASARDNFKRLGTFMAVNNKYNT